MRDTKFIGSFGLLVITFHKLLAASSLHYRAFGKSSSRQFLFLCFVVNFLCCVVNFLCCVVNFLCCGKFSLLRDKFASVTPV